MAMFTTPIKTLDDLFLHTVKDIYHAEHQITKALPKMIEKARDAELKQALMRHLEETKGHVTRLEQVFKHLGEKPEGVTCEAIKGIIEEAKEVMSDIGNPEVLDAGIIGSAQTVEHYEMSRYGTLIALARRLDHAGVVPLLRATLDEEKNADAVLTRVAESAVNVKAA
ncbi:MAG: ferritin-like domain-containing protein [Acetobacteraceae bacterium]